MEHDASLSLRGALVALSIGMRKRFAFSIRKREEHLRSMLFAAPDPFIVCDRRGSIVFWNAAAETLFGDSSNKALGRSLASCIQYGRDDVSDTKWQPSLPTGQRPAAGATVEANGKRSDGTKFPIELSITTWGTRGEEYHTLIARDATDRRKGEAQREAARRLLQDTIDGVNQPIMVIGPDYRVLLMNRVARQDYATGSEISPAYCYRVSHDRSEPCSGVEHPCPLPRVRETLQPTLVVHEHIQKSGGKRLVEILVAPLRSDDGTFAGIVESANDITERMQAEQALRESERQYKRLYFENRELAQNLRAQLAQKGELLKSIITAQEDERKRVARDLHDELGQSLSGLTLQVRALEHDITTNPTLALAQLNAICSLISETTDRMYDLILDLRPAGLDDLGPVTALRAEADRLMTRSGIVFELDSSSLGERLAPEIETTLYRIFQEALCNVIRHADASHVRVILARHNGNFEGEVVDNGRGFDADAIWVDGKRPRGLGLLGMQERVAHCGGRLELFSKVGSGTRVRVEIPLGGEVGR